MATVVSVPPGAGVIGSCELPCVGIKLKSFARAVFALN